MDLHGLTILGYTSILLLSISISIGIGIYSLRRYHVAGTRSFGAIILLEAAWTVGFLFEFFASTLPWKIFWDNVQWVPTLLLPLALLSFALEYTGRTLRHPARTWAALAALPVLTLLLIFTNSWHGLAMVSIEMVKMDFFSEYTYQYGALVWIGMLYDYAIVLVALFFLIKLFNRQQEVYRTQTLIIAAGFATPIIGTIITLIGIRLWIFRDLSPITFTLSNLLIAIGLFRYRIFDLLPLARDLVVESMEDGVMVLDMQKRLVDINQTAKKMIGRPEQHLIGKPVDAFTAQWLQLSDLDAGLDSMRREISIRNDADGKVLDLRITRMTSRLGIPMGYLIILRDISDRERAEAIQQAAYVELERQVGERTAQLSNTVGRLVTEITERRSIEKALRSKSENLYAVSRLAIQLADASAETDIIPLIAEYTKNATGALGSVVSIFDPQKNVLSVKYVAAQSRLLKKLNRMFSALPNLDMPITPEIKQQMIHNLVGWHSRISEITFGMVPEDLSRRLEKQLKIGEMVSFSLQVEGDLYGSIVVFLPPGAPLPATDMLEAFAHVVSVTLRRIRAEQALRASEERFRALMENANDLISVLDREGNQIFSANVESRRRILGYFPESMIKKNLLDYIHPDDQAQAREVLRRILQSPGNQELFEMRYQRADGAYIWLETYVKNLLQHPMVQGVVITSREITERKLAEEEQRRLNRTLTMISECNQALVRMDDELALLTTICRIIVEMGGYRFTWITFQQGSSISQLKPTIVYDSQTGLRTFLPGEDAGVRNKEIDFYVDPAQITESLAERKRFKAVFSEQIRQGKPVIMNDLRALTEFPIHRAEMLRQGILSTINLPLVFGSEVYGRLHIHSGDANAFDAKEMQLLNELAQDVSFGIHVRRMRADRDRAERVALQANTELHQAYESTLEGWSRALELRERETAGHSQRVVEQTLELARQFGFSEQDCIHIRRGALLHDIGKMGIPDSILLKPAELTAEDWEVMHQHPVFARNLLFAIPYLEPALVIPYYHHERWDGSGYPQGLKGEEIPLPARIFAVVDVWDALGWDRPYRKAWKEKDILQYLSENAGLLFDPQVVKLFLGYVHRTYVEG